MENFLLIFTFLRNFLRKTCTIPTNNKYFLIYNYYYYVPIVY